MIDLAISIDDDERDATIVETNHGDLLTAPKWPQDSDFRLVAFAPNAKKCDIISPSELAQDIAFALEAVNQALGRSARKPEWYHRLKKCAAGAKSSLECPFGNRP